MCLGDVIHWLVDLDTTINPSEQVKACGRCRSHAANNFRLIQKIPAASGSEPIDVYRRWLAQQPPAPKKTVQSLWGDYRVDPDNFVPAVTKVLDIVHSAGPKVRWAVRLSHWDAVPMTNLSAKEIILPNYFDSPHALGRTHEEILDAMTGAAMHEAGHAAYDKAETIIEAQRRMRYRHGESAWAAATCLNVVADYNLERKVIERYPAFRHYFTECHRWSVRDTLPDLAKALQQDEAEDKLNVRIAVLVWEMLGPGDLERAGATLTPKLTWIIKKCFDILKYAYTKGLLNKEDGKLRTARALYELIKIVNPVGAPPSVVVQVPMPPVPPGGTTCGFPGQPQPGQPGQPGGQTGQPSDPQDDDEDHQPGSRGTPTDQESDDEGEPIDTDDVTDPKDETSGQPEHPSGSAGRSGEDPEDDDQENGSDEDSEDPQGPGGDAGSGDDGSTGEGVPGEDSEDEGASGPEGQGGRDADGTGTGTASGGSSEDDGPGSEDADQAQDAQDQDDVDGRAEKSNEPGIADNTSPDDGDPGGSVSSTGPSSKGGKSGSGKGIDPKDDPFTGAGDLKDDPARRSNSKKDALDDLEDQNKGQAEVDKNPYQPTYLEPDRTFNERHRQDTEQLNNPPNINHREVDKFTAKAMDFPKLHRNRISLLAPVIGRLKKVLKFRNADWGGRQTGRRSGTLTRRHVSRLAAFGSDKVFHKTQPDQTPKVRIALLVDESESMNTPQNGIPLAVGAKNAATALTQALHGIRGVKLWCWGYSMHKSYSSSRYEANMRQYVDPFHQVDPVNIEAPNMSGGTPTGEAMDYAAETISKGSTPDEKKVVFIITDGEAGGVISTGSTVRKWTGKVTFVHIGLGNTVDKDIPYYVGPVTDIALLPDLLSESVTEILR